ncbi:DUF4957 domain-containing protein [Geofilum sp. OHC36d9]|uniref:DUF4957 domain-containing protein n=1 Tax=Geofilum sp. OHC36d9 TaxID=3458413 RepID=UPI004034CE5D
MNKLYKIPVFLLGLMVLTVVAACSDDIDPEITEVEVSQLFSPVDLEVRVKNQIQVQLNWTKNSKAVSYTVEFYKADTTDFSGTSVKVLEGITNADLPYIVEGFDGETTYAVRVKAVGEDILDSKWTAAMFTTDFEQILNPLTKADIGTFDVTVSWPEGEEADYFWVMPGEIKRPISDDEIAAGELTISGLTAETDYTVTMYRGDSKRGVLNFETWIDLSSAIVVQPGDDVATIIGNAEAGSKIAFEPGVYDVAGNIEINNSVGLFSASSTEKPVINGAVFRMKSGAGLRLRELILNGSTSDGNQVIVYDDNDPDNIYPAVSIEDCEISDYVKGVFYVSKVALIESVSITGTTYANVECVGGDFIDFRQGMTRQFTFRNNTVYNCALARDCFRMDAGGSSNFPEENSELFIENNTFYNVSNDGKRILYIRLASHAIHINKNIFAETGAYYSNQSATTVVEMDANNYFNAEGFYSENTVTDTGKYTTVDPGFADAENGDFTISNEDLIYYQIGSLNWID